MIKKWNVKQTNWNINGDKMKCFQGVIKKKTQKMATKNDTNKDDDDHHIDD
jgi:hypothetical protein